MIRVIPYHYTPSVRVYKNNKTNIMRNGKCNFGKKIHCTVCQMLFGFKIANILTRSKKAKIIIYFK